MSRFRDEGLPQTGGAGTTGPIRITADEAQSSHVDDLLKRQASLRGEGGITADRSRKWYYSNWFIFSIAGGLFAFIAWGINEPITDDTLHFRTTIMKIQRLPVNADGESAVPVALLSIEVDEETTQQLAAMAGEEGPAEAEDVGLPVMVSSRTKMVQKNGQTTELNMDELKEGQDVAIHLSLQNPMNVAAIDPTQSGGHYDSLKDAMSWSETSSYVFFALIAALVGLGIGAADGFMCRLMRRALLCGVVGLVVGFVGGFVSTQLANVVYAMLGEMIDKMRAPDGELTAPGFMAQLGARSLAWALAGMTMGLGQGLALRSGRLLLYGFLGGLIGGLLGGLLFDPIQEFIVGDGALSAHWARMIGIVTIGTFVGLMIGVVELLARDAWLNMVRGPLAGKEFLIFKDLVRVGASPSSDIYLFNDDEVAEQHAVIRAVADNYEIETVNQNVVMVNGRPVTRAKLRSGDQIKLGTTVFAFQRRKTA